MSDGTQKCNMAVKEAVLAGVSGGTITAIYPQGLVETTLGIVRAIKPQTFGVEQALKPLKEEKAACESEYINIEGAKKLAIEAAKELKNSGVKDAGSANNLTQYASGVSAGRAAQLESAYR